MQQIPADATLWDSGDWIEFHRSAVRRPDLTVAAGEDETARLALLEVSLLRAARSYFELTGAHLDLYDTIARAHAAARFGIPLDARPVLESSGVLLLTLRPDAEELCVEVDLALPFTSVLVVRIDPGFRVDGRMVPRRTLGEASQGLRELRWRRLPRTR